MQQLLKDNLTALSILFKENNVEKAYAFGSIVTDNFNANSDVDFLIRFAENIDPIQKGEHWFTLYYTLQNLFKREIDLIREEDIKNPYLLKTINLNKALVYG